MQRQRCTGCELLTDGRPVLVVGAGVSGRAALQVLADLGVPAELTDDDDAVLNQVGVQGFRVITRDAAIAQIANYAVVVVSPGVAPTAPLPVAAADAGVPVWGDVELAWRLDQAGCYGSPRMWLVVTGTNGKTTTASMLFAMVMAQGQRAALCGNIGRPVLDVLALSVDVLVVELSSFQLFWSPSLRPEAGVVLNIAEDHLDWHGNFSGYVAAKAQALQGRVAVAGLDDSSATAVLAHSDALVKVGFRCGEPDVGELGVRDGMLIDRAFADDLELAPVALIPVAGVIGVLDALGAAALARAVGVLPAAIAAGLSGFDRGAHRGEVVAVADGVRYVDNSKASNPHAAQAAVLAYSRVVWIAGGLLKGASVESMVASVADRLVGAVVIGADRAVVAKALSRHAPDVPVIEVVTREDAVVHEINESGGTHETRVVEELGTVRGSQVMTEAVAAAITLARCAAASSAPKCTTYDQNDTVDHQDITVLLAPAGASFDQFNGYAQRGEIFTAAVRAAVQ